MSSISSMPEVWRWMILECGGRVLGATSMDGTREIQSRRFAWRSLNYLAPVVHARLEAGGQHVWNNTEIRDHGKYRNISSFDTIK